MSEIATEKLYLLHYENSVTGIKDKNAAFGFAEAAFFAKDLFLFI